MNRFEQPARQSTIAILFILGKVFRILFRQLWVLILVVLFNPKKKVFTGFTLGLIAIAAIGAVTSIISYFRLYYYVKNGELVLEKGVLRKMKVSVPLDRIQSVNFKQGLLHQAFNVVSVEIDTAGSVGKEFSLDALRKEDAEALRTYIENARPVINEQKELESDTSIESHHTKTHQPAQLLFRLSPADLIKIGVSQNHLRTAGIIMVFFLSFFDDVEEALDLKLSERLEEFLGLAQDAEFLPYLLIGVPFFLLISFFITLFRTILQYFDLRFWRTNSGFKMESGLFTKQEVSANLNKIQYVRWDSSPLKRMFNMVSVRMPQAASVQVTRRLSVNLPGCYQDHLQAVKHAYFPEENSYEYSRHGINERIIYRMFVVQGILPVGILMLFSYSWLENDIWIWLLWLPFALWLSFRYHQNWRWEVSEEGLRTSWGVIGQHNVLLQWYKVQAVTIRQNYFLQRRGLTHLIVYTAAGSVTIPYIPIEKALEVQDYVLYKVEVDERSWM